MKLEDYKAIYSIIPAYARWALVILLLGFHLTFYAQSESKILLVYVEMNPSDCDGGCQEATREFRELFKNTVSASGLFREVMSNTIYDRREKANSVENYCRTNGINHYMLSRVVEKRDISGKKKYSMEFRMYDLNKNQIENPNLNFDISIAQPGSSNEKILSVLKSELDHFVKNDYKFKEVVKVESFKDMSAGGKNPHVEGFPSHLADKLNATNTTNQKYYYLFVPQGVNEQLDSYYISGQIKIIEENDSLQVVFWINDKNNSVSILIDDDYWDPNEKKSNELLIREVIAILRKIN